MDEQSLEAQAAAKASANGTLPRGVIVVDLAGWIRAADPEAMAWIRATAGSHTTDAWHLSELATGSAFVEDLRRLIAGEHLHSSIASLPSGPGMQTDTSYRWTLLSGDIGPHALLHLEPRTQDSANHLLDALTQLPDRRAVTARIAQWRKAEHRSPHFAVLFVDFDDFKSVNDHYGHATGDVVLQTLAARLQQSIRDGDLACRYGGDEFVVLVQGAASSAEVEPVVARLAIAIQQPIHVNGRSLKLTATIGWAAPHGDDWTTESLVAAADADMYARKRAMLR
jgi:diguanylate cyclase (GGDEF)-like protein